MVAIIDVGTPSLTVGGVIPWLGIPHCIEGKGAEQQQAFVPAS